MNRIVSTSPPPSAMGPFVLSIGEKTCGFTTARSRSSHLKYARFFPSKMLHLQHDLDQFIKYFITNAKKRSYCYKVIETLAFAFKSSKDHEKWAKRQARNAYDTRRRVEIAAATAAVSSSTPSGVMYEASSGRPVVTARPLWENTTTPEKNTAAARPRVAFNSLDVIKLYEFCSERMQTLTHAMVYGCRHTGCRPIELLKLTRDQWLQLCDNGTCRFNSKTGQVAFVMAPRVARLIFPIIIRHTEFCNDQQLAGLYCKALREFNAIWKQLHGSRKCKGDGFKLFRCLVAYEGINNRRDTFGLKQLLRHSTINLTEHYAKKFGPMAALSFVNKYYSGVSDDRTSSVRASGNE